MGKILRVEALRQMDITEDRFGKPVFFSIKFHLKDGEIVFLPRAVKTGLRMNMKANRYRGVRPVDEKGNPTGHIYPVSIDNILEFNLQTVKL